MSPLCSERSVNPDIIIRQNTKTRQHCQALSEALIIQDLIMVRRKERVKLIHIKKIIQLQIVKLVDIK